METDNDMLYEIKIRKSDLVGLDDKAIEAFIKSLSNAVGDVCWDFGVHN